jgi:hypothetical protein
MDMDEGDDLYGEARDFDGGWCEATGDPALDQMGYQSPRRTGNLTGFKSSQIDWLAQAKADRAKREARREADRQTDRLAEKLAAQLKAVEQNKAETRQRVEQRKEVGRRQQSSPTPAPARPKTTGSDHPAQGPNHPAREEIMRRSLTELQPGQHGAYFERRVVRRWWAPWTKRVVWQQVSAWANTTPPRSGTEVVTVGSLDELSGKVHTIGTVGPGGTVEW